MFARKSLIRQTKSPIRNLMMLFFTIMLGFGSVMVMANLDIQTNIQNARQTIMRVTITSDGTDGGNILLDFNTGNRIYISDTILDAQTSFSGKVLGLDANNKIVYVPASGLIVSGATGIGGAGDTYWTGEGTSNIINTNIGKVYVGGTPSPTDTTKFYVQNSGSTEAIFEETNPGNAANIYLKNTVNEWRIGGFYDRFYIGKDSTPYFNISDAGNVGIGVAVATQKLDVNGSINIMENGGLYLSNSANPYILKTPQSRYGNPNDPRTVVINYEGTVVSGTAIAGDFVNISARRGGTLPNTGGHLYVDGNAGIGTSNPKARLQAVGNVIAGDYGNTIVGTNSTIGGGSGNYLSGNSSFLGAGGYAFYPNGNMIFGGASFLGAGEGNTVTGNYSFIGAGEQNLIRSANYSSIVGGSKNEIWGGINNFIGGGGDILLLTGSYSSIVGGMSNSISGDKNFIGGGEKNKVNGNSQYSSIVGGYNNLISGSRYSVAMGTYAKAVHNYSFVRNSNFPYSFQTQKEKTFIVNAPNGVGINTNNPLGDLHIGGSGVVVFTPQSNNPQGPNGYHVACLTTGSVMYFTNMNSLCYCDGTTRKLVSSNDRCTI